MFGIVMATDLAYAPFAETAVLSIRRFNQSVPIIIYTCGCVPSLEELKTTLSIQIKQVPLPEFAADAASPLTRQLCWSRTAKLRSMIESPFDLCLYLDADIVAQDDVSQITALLKEPAEPAALYMLLRRPGIPKSIYKWRWTYISNPSITRRQMTALINQTFDLNYSVAGIHEILCWNGGVIFGTKQAVNTLAQLWYDFYIRMVCGSNRKEFTSKDQLCLWLAADQLKERLTVQELPLTWNFLPGHILEEENVRPQQLVNQKIIHFAQEKAKPWAKQLRDEVWYSFNGQT